MENESGTETRRVEFTTDAAPERVRLPDGRIAAVEAAAAPAAPERVRLPDGRIAAVEAAAAAAAPAAPERVRLPDGRIAAVEAAAAPAAPVQPAPVQPAPVQPAPRQAAPRQAAAASAVQPAEAPSGLTLVEETAAPSVVLHAGGLANLGEVVAGRLGLSELPWGMDRRSWQACNGLDGLAAAALGLKEAPKDAAKVIEACAGAFPTAAIAYASAERSMMWADQTTDISPTAVVTGGVVASPVLGSRILPLVGREVMVQAGEVSHVAIDEPNAAIRAKEASAEARTVDLAVVKATPHRLAGAVRLRIEDLAVRSGVGEAIMAALVNQTRYVAEGYLVAGAAGLSTPAGVRGTLANAAALPADGVQDGDAAATAGEVAKLYSAIWQGAIDGQYAEMGGDCVLLTTPAFYGWLAGTILDSETSMLDALARSGWRVRATRHMGTGALADSSIVATIARQIGVMEAAQLTLWPTMTLTVDRMSQRQEGFVVVTSDLLADVTVSRPANFRTLKTSA